MLENTYKQLCKEIKIESGETIKISVELTNIKEKNTGIAKDFLKTMFEEINQLF